MKTTPLLLLGMIAAPAFALESVVLPAAHPASRYDTMLERSPFALATPVVAPPPPVASEFSQWYVSGLGRWEDKDFVSIKSRDLGTNFSLYGNEPHSENGVQLVSVEWSNERGKSTVTIKKGSEFGKLEFNQAEVATPAAAPQPGNRPGMPPQRPGGVQPGGNAPVTNMPVTGGGIAQPRPGGPGAPLNQPRVAIPRPTNAPIPAPPTTISPTNAGAVPAPGNSDNRRRIRVINPKP